MGNGQSPSGLASSASSPRCGEPFCAGFARVEFSRAMPARKASSLCGEVAEHSDGRRGFLPLALHPQPKKACTHPRAHAFFYCKFH